MNTQGYAEHIAKTVEGIPFDEPIHTDAIAKEVAQHFHLPYERARQLANQSLKRMADRKQIERFQKGLYTHAGILAEWGTIVPPDTDKIMYRILTKNDDKVIGYETGPSLLNRIGLSTQMPADIWVATNKHRNRIPDGCHITAMRPPTTVTSENYRYLQFLDAIDLIGSKKYSIDAVNPTELMRDVAAKLNLSQLTLVFYARKYYKHGDVIRLIDILMEGFDETT